MTVEIYDTTLRDGTQREGLSPTVGDKLRIARLIDKLGVGYIEGGWPGANPKDDEFFVRARNELDLEHAILVAFGATARPGADPADDPQVAALLDAATDVVCIVGKAWTYHVTEALRTDFAEAIRMVADTVEYLRDKDRRVFFDAEHCFDGFAADSSFTLDVLGAAHAAGAERLILCDTNGGTLPDRAASVIDAVATQLPDAILGVHFHNDSGCAVANSLIAVERGVTQVQGCVNGYGERTGNADLCTVIPNLVLKMGHKVVTTDQLATLTSVAHHVAEITNTSIDAYHPYVGVSAFAHKAGLHTSALARQRDAYEHIDPRGVGNTTRMVVSELAGRSTVVAKARDHGWDLDPETAQAVVDRIKDLEHRGYLFEAADASFELLVRATKGWTQEFFHTEAFRAFVELRTDGNVVAEATVKVRVAGQRSIVTREGRGPVHALDLALHDALTPHYPEVERIRLVDYKVRDLDSADGTAARVRVLVVCSDGDARWGTVGVHENIIEASWEALESGIVYGLLRARG